MTKRWPSLTSETLTDQVYGILRNRLLAGSWEPGSFVREQEISARLGVSRTPIREALGRLAADRFLERIPRRGFRVPEQTADELLELYPILATLEVLATERSMPELDEGELAVLRQINGDYETACRNADVQAGIQLNNRFHHRLTARCGNRRLCSMLDELRAEVTRLEIWAFSSFAQWERSIREHAQILDAVEAGERDLALDTLEANRLMTYTDFVTRMGRAAAEASTEEAQDIVDEQQDASPRATPREAS